MSKKVRTIIYCFALINAVFITVSFLPLSKATPSITNPIVLSQTQAMTQTDGINKPIKAKDKEYNILLLGLDARRGDAKPRCDAIHIFSFSSFSDNLIITSLPRGTRINIPNVASESAYLSNNCHINGIDDTISEIEKISGIKIDAYVTAGFSEVLGLLRTVNLPTTSTLQYLRNRRYGIGDYQRSHNQAVFLKDMILAHFEQIYNLPKNFRKFVYRSLDTNLNYETAEYLLELMAQKKIYQHEENINLVTKPERSRYVKELHIDIENNSGQGQLADKDFIDYQNNLKKYLNNLIETSVNFINSGNRSKAFNILKTPFAQNIWWQVEDEKTRDEIHFDLFTVFLDSHEDQLTKERLIEEYIAEMKLFNKNEYIQKIEEWSPVKRDTPLAENS